MHILITQADVELERYGPIGRKPGSRPYHVRHDDAIVEPMSLCAAVEPPEGAGDARCGGLGQVEPRSIGGDALQTD